MSPTIILALASLVMSCGIRLFGHRRRRRTERLRRVVAAAIVAGAIGRPARLVSVRWWRAADVVAAVHLTASQVEAIDRRYQERLSGRRHCVERLVAASNQVDQFMRDGVYDDLALRQTQAVAHAAADERALIRLVNDDIVTMLSPEQRRRLAAMRRTIE